MVKIAAVAAGAVVLAGAVVAQPTINSPVLTECQPVALQWSNAEGTVRLSIIPGGQVSASPIETLPDQTGASGSYVWNTNIASGTNVTILINDDSGVPNYSSPRVIMAGSTSCLNAASSSGSSSAAASSTGAAAGGASSSAASSATSASSSAAMSSSTMSSAMSSSSASRSSSMMSSSTSGSAPAQTTSRAANAAAAFSPATAGLSVLAAVGALLPFL